MTDETLEVFGKRWNSRAKTEIAFEPEAEILKPNAIELDIPALDDMLGGGIPRGRTTIIFGEAAAGKTLLSQLIIAAAQRRGGKAIFLDVERTYDPKWFRLTGVDTSSEKLLVVRPRSLEQTFDIVTDALDNLKPEVIVLDSIPALIPQTILDAEMAKQDFRGVAARKITEGIAKSTTYNSSTALVLINQIRMEMGRTFGNPEKQSGGKALQFHSSLTIRVRRGKWLTDVAQETSPFDDVSEKDAERIGFLLKLRTEKNKLHRPWLETDLKFYFNGTVDPIGSLIHLAIQRGIIEVAGRGWFVLPDSEEKIHGLPAVEKTLKEDEELKQKIIQLTKEAK